MGSGVSPGKDRTTTASLGGNKRRQPFPHDSGRAGEIEERRSVGGKTDFFYADENASSETSTHNSAHTTPSTLYSNATLGMETRARKGKRKRCDATAADAGEAFRGLPNHLVATHILNSEHFDDPADLARLPAVSRAMRDAVTETGLRFEELDEMCALEVGCLSAVQRRQRQGRLSHRQYLCQAAARSGLLEELKELRENGTRWDEFTCAAATKGGHLQVLRWLRTNNCPWDKRRCEAAAQGGHLEVLQWAHANGCPWDEKALLYAVHFGHKNVVRALIEAGANVNMVSLGETPLYIAAQNGRDVMVWLLIEAGADVNKAINNGQTPLFMAARNGCETVVQALIEAGADINQASDIGKTLLYFAAQNGHEVVVRALIGEGADVNLARDDDETPLHNAAEGGYEAIVRALIAACAHVNKATDDG